MRTCANCGVSLETHMNFCPLCGEPVLDQQTENLEYIKFREEKQKELTEYQRLNSSQKHKIFWEISGMILISGLLVTLIIDLLANNHITWSAYSITIGLVIFANTTLIRFVPDKLYWLLAGSFLSTSALLVLLDIFEGGIDWSLSLGIPILLIAYVIANALMTIIRKLKDKGLNLIAYSLLALAILSIFTEAFISLYMSSKISLEWSLVVIASVFPVSALLLFVHYRLKKGTELKRFFNI